MNQYLDFIHIEQEQPVLLVVPQQITKPDSSTTQKLVSKSHSTSHITVSHTPLNSNEITTKPQLPKKS